MIPMNPKRPTTPRTAQRTHTLVEMTPGKLPTPGRPAPGPKASPSAPSVLPPYTAPARLARVRRERKGGTGGDGCPCGRQADRIEAPGVGAKLNIKILYIEIGAGEVK